MKLRFTKPFWVVAQTSEQEVIMCGDLFHDYTTIVRVICALVWPHLRLFSTGIMIEFHTLLLCCFLLNTRFSIQIVLVSGGPYVMGASRLISSVNISFGAAAVNKCFSSSLRAFVFGTPT